MGFFPPSHVADDILDLLSSAFHERQRSVQQYGPASAQWKAVAPGWVRVDLDIEDPLATMHFRKFQIWMLLVQLGEFLEQPFPAGLEIQDKDDRQEAVGEEASAAGGEEEPSVPR
jgi:hypothetical protein